MIHVACIDISQIDENLYQALFSHASPARQERANAYLHQENKVCCIVADALTRYAARQALGLPDLTVAIDDNGKPYFPDAPMLHFNLSHSGRWVVIAYGNSPVGIDVQALRPDADAEKLARRHFTAVEQERLFCEHGEHFIKQFYQLWTAKESYLKYLGTGLRRALHSFCVLSDLGVHLHHDQLDDHCLCVCTQEELVQTTILQKEEIL